MKLGKVVIRESRMRSSLKDYYGEQMLIHDYAVYNIIHVVKLIAMLGCWHESM
ncbi:hypothetical protein KQI45_13800 [Clostridium sporogenes]|uniref:hypothetical protein n=1 Tax=Clostridium sporogenes TaxID=1509 RepID=UPI001C1118C5|nr:hypothetical protein [Clostridium sporogenes]MBU5301146.1 hypothetical protein [Clostridium sporogenes]